MKAIKVGRMKASRTHRIAFDFESPNLPDQQNEELPDHQGHSDMEQPAAPGRTSSYSDQMKRPGLITPAATLSRRRL